MIQYILECIAFQLVFLIIYDFFLKRETFFQWNRLYLIGTYVLSMALPWIKIEALKTTVPEHYYVYPEFLWKANTVSATVTSSEVPNFNLSWEEGILYGGMVLAAVYFGYKLIQIYKLRNEGVIQRFPTFTKIIVKNSELAFSFFRSIFLGDKVVQREHQSIIQHELVHIEQRHSWDLLFFELMRIVGWFNPLVYVYQSRVSELHEFIADSKVAKTDKKEQYKFLLSQIFQTENISFVNQFFKTSLIKKRIVMLQKSQSKKIWKLKYLALVPIVLGILFYTSSEAQESENGNVATESQSEDTALIKRVTAKIEKEVAELGSLINVHNSYPDRAPFGDSDGPILSKEVYFESAMLFRMSMQEMSKAMKKEEGSQFNTFSSRIPLPSSTRYQGYVSRKKAFQILDENLKFSITSYDKNWGYDVRQLDKNDRGSDESFELEVADVSDLTGNEIRTFNNRMNEIFIERTPKYASLILKDDRYRFLVSMTKPMVGINTFPKLSSSDDEQSDSKNDRSDSEIIIVDDIENLTSEEENTLFERLQVLSSGTEVWQLFVKDNNSQLKFVPSENGSYISGPNGERIHAKLALDSKLSSQEASEFAAILQKRKQAKQDLSNYANQDNTKLSNEKSATIDRYNQLVAERKRLLKSSDEKNPVIVNLDQQLAGLRKAAFGDSETVPFAEVEEVPVFPGCEDEGDKRACFQAKMQRHISKNFSYPQEAQEKGIQGRVSILFTISETGTINNIKTRGPHQLLEDEAERIISRLPEMKPGKHKGKLVNVPFSIPITFKLEGDGAMSSTKWNLDTMMEIPPLYIIDGEESTKDAMNYINPKDIASINVLKDEFATNMYGERGKNGAIVVTTKKNRNDAEEPNEIYKAGTNTIAVSATATTKNGIKIISGTVTDGMIRLPGATIGIQGAERGVISDFDGNFTIKAKKGDIILFQYIGLPILKLTITDEENYQMTKKKN